MNIAELEWLRSLLPTYTAGEIWNLASKILPPEDLEKIWRIPRENITAFILECINNLPLNPPFLDIGCGRRSYKPEVIAKFGERIAYIALDHYFPQEGEVGRLPNILGSALHLPLPDLSINTVICSEVLEHLEEDEAAAKEMTRVLNPGGKLILTLPGKDIPKHEKLPYQKDYRRYSPEEIRNLFSTHDFEILVLEQRFLQGLEINILAFLQKNK